MSRNLENFQSFQEERKSKYRGTVCQGVTMKGWIPQPSSALICFLSALCTGLLFIIIILIVTMTRQGVDRTEQSLELKLRNLSLQVDHRLSQLYEDDSRIMEKLTFIESFMKDYRAARVMSRFSSSNSLMKRILSPEVIGSVSRDSQRILSAVGKIKDRIHKGNGSADPLCGVDWIHYGFSCYFQSWTERSWEKAKKHCENMKAQLVVINGKDEMDFLHKISGSSDLWIGLGTLDGVWTWVDGTPYETNSKFWKEGEPTDGHNSDTEGWKRCAQYVKGHEWESYSCSWDYHYICEKKIIHDPVPHSGSTEVKDNLRAHQRLQPSWLEELCDREGSARSGSQKAAMEKELNSSDFPFNLHQEMPTNAELYILRNNISRAANM
ncbi:asialoglycoprotein receptor 1-like [Mantella aurantiaca]